MKLISIVITARDASAEASADGTPPPNANSSKGQPKTPQASHGDAGLPTHWIKALHCDMAGFINQCGGACVEFANIPFTNMLGRKFGFLGIDDQHLQEDGWSTNGELPDMASKCLMQLMYGANCALGSPATANDVSPGYHEVEPQL